MHRYAALIVLLICSFADINLVLAAEITRGAMLSNSCAACHGTDGKSPGAIPGIDGKTAEYISQTMYEFREGKRSATVMGRHATGYTDDEIRLIADFFSRQD